MRNGAIILKGKPSLRNFFNKQTDGITGKFTIYRHTCTNYDTISRQLQSKFGKDSQQYLQFSIDFAEDLIETLTNPNHILEVNIWLWGKKKALQNK